MSTIAQLKSQVENANALGRQNLTDKGIEINGTETTYQLMQMIAEISGGGASYTSIVYKEDGTIELLDTDGVTHTMACVYDGDKLVSVSYDGKEIAIGYKGDELVSVGNTVVNLSGLFPSVRTEIEVKGAGTFVCTAFGTKTTDETAIFGYYTESNGTKRAFLLGRTKTSVETSNSEYYPTIDYNGELWYYSFIDVAVGNESQLTDGSVQPYSQGYSTDITKTLDYYFMVE